MSIQKQLEEANMESLQAKLCIHTAKELLKEAKDRYNLAESNRRKLFQQLKGKQI